MFQKIVSMSFIIACTLTTLQNVWCLTLTNPIINFGLIVAVVEGGAQLSLELIYKP